MKKTIVTLFYCCLSFLIGAQNVGINVANPTRAKLEINGMVGNTVGIFGGQTAGIGIIANWPEIGYNIYYNNGSRFIADGYGALEFFNHNSGYFGLEIYPAGTANNVIQGYARVFTIAPSGNVGIGETEPVRKLQVQNGSFRIQKNNLDRTYLEFLGTAADQYDGRIEYNAFGTDLFVTASSNDFASNNYDRLRVSLIANPTFSFTVYGSAVTTGGSWVNSDKKLKKNLHDLDIATELVKKLHPVSYEFEKEKFSNLQLPAGKQFGFSAQEVELVFPDIVKSDKQPVRINASGEREMEDVKAVNYVALIPILTKAIQEQQESMIAMQKRIESLESQNEMLTRLLRKN